MCDAFDKEGYYYEDSDFALDLNLQDKRRELVYLLEHDNALVALNSCRQELMNLQDLPTPRSENLLKCDDGLVVLSSCRPELMSLQGIPTPRRDNLLHCDDGLVASNSYEQDIKNVEAVSLRHNNLLHTDAYSIVDPGQTQATSRLEEDKASPDPSGLPLPIWASSDLVGNWLEQSMADFTIKYYMDSVEEFFERFDIKDVKYS